MNTAIRFIVTGMITSVAFCFASLAQAAIFVKIPTIGGDVTGPDGRKDWFVADNFSFGVEREMKESGEKGGTADINIGVGELQECTISKSMDVATGALAQAAASGLTVGPAEICFADMPSDEGTPQCYLHYKLDRAFVKSWSTSGDADDRPTEEVAFYYNKIAFGYVSTDEDGNEREGSMSWEDRKKQPWEEGLEDIFDIIYGSGPPR